MRIAVFGGTGQAGQHLLRQALDQGYQVQALARRPDNLNIRHDSLVVISGTIQDLEAVEKTVAGVVAVLSVLGPTHNRPSFEISQGMAHIIAAMKQQGVKRLIISSGAGVSDPNDRPGLGDRLMKFLLKHMAKNVLADMVQTVDLVRSSGLEWTVVRVPMLTHDPQTGRIKTGYLGKGTGSRVTRADLASFMLAQVQNTSFLHRSPVISN